MVSFLIGVSAILWVVLEFAREKNQLKWKRRVQRLEPFWVELRRDARATEQFAREWPERIRFRREMRKNLGSL